MKNSLSALLITLLTAFVFAMPETGASDDSRVQIGLRLFRTLMAADEELERKRSSDGALEVVLLYREGRPAAEAFAEALRSSGHGTQQGAVRGYPLRIHVSDDPSLAAYIETPPAGIYLVEPLAREELKQAVDWAARHRRLLFSPFPGDVERGAAAGFAIEVRVKPYLNLTALERSAVQLKPLLFKVSKQYE